MNLISEGDQRGLNWSQVLLECQCMKGNVTELVGLNKFQGRKCCPTVTDILRANEAASALYQWAKLSPQAEWQDETRWR